MNYEEWLDKFKDIHLDEIDNTLFELKVPLNIYSILHNTIEEHESEILEAIYIKEFSNFADQAYEEHKERDI